MQGLSAQDVVLMWAAFEGASSMAWLVFTEITNRAETAGRAVITQRISLSSLKSSTPVPLGGSYARHKINEFLK